MKFNALLLFTLLSLNSLNAQKPLSGFPKLTEQGLNLTEVAFEKDANAVILDEEGYLEITNGVYYLKVKRRIKVLDDKGIEEGNVAIPYYSHNKIESHSQVKAQTLNLENGQWMAYPLNSKEVFDVNLNQYYNETRFAMPNVKKGSILEYEYLLTSKSLFLIDAWDFQHELPTISSKFKLKINANIDYNNLQIGNRLLARYKGKKTDVWELNNLPSIKEIKYAYNVDNYIEKIRLQMAGYLGENGFVSTIGKWADLKKELVEANSKTFNPSAVKKYAESIPNGATELETFDNVLNAFKRDFKWNNFRGIYTQLSQKDLIDRRSSNSTDLNYLFNHILERKGISANLVLVASRSKGKLLTNFPFLDQFDYLVNSVTINNGGNYLINAAEISDNDYNFAPLYLYNDYGFVIDAKDDKFVEFNQFLSKNTVEFKYSVRQNELVEQRKNSFDGYFYTKRVDKKDLVNLYVTPPIYIQHDDDLKEPIYKDRSYLSSSVKKMEFKAYDFIPLDNPLKYYIDTFEFNEENRTNDIEFNFPFYQKVIVNVDIPDGYEVIQAENFKALVKPSDDLIYGQNFAIKGNKLQIMYEFYIAKAKFKPSDYNMLKSFFADVQKETTKQFSLKKKN